MPRVKLFAIFREIAGISEFDVEGRNIGEVLENVTEKFPKLKEIFFADGKLREFVQIMINGKHFKEEMNFEVDEKDVVAIFPPVSGG
ncbi:MAG: ubiquitin-like small modifier protein 1 [Archaeoglobaceae archaeon]|nr:MoaD family protein [Archaeoglobaceae archaeon]MDW7989705.1 ubiquitin-like small modifier protein 1 [Archaeoglobaceae archaeon]